MTPGQRSLNNFYRSVSFDHPELAALMSDDIVTVAMYGLVEDKTPALDAAHRLRRLAIDLPVIQQRVLDNALFDLGYA